MRVLVTGATGFIGAQLVNRLVAGGAQVRVLVRSLTRAQPLIDQGAVPITGEITDRNVVRAAVADMNIVYHLAGRLLVPGVPASDYRATHVDGTRMLVACCAELTTLKRFVHCSTTGVLGVTGDQPADEEAPFRPTNVYEATKAEAELVVRDALQRGLPGVILRPGLVYGPGDLHLVGFFRSILQRRFRPIGRRPVSLHPIYIDDMVDALVQCGQNTAAIGECFNIAGREAVTLAALAATIADAEGVTLPPGRIPLVVARTAAAGGDLLPAKLRRLAPLTRTRLDFLTHSRVYNVAKAQRLLGFAAMTDLPSGIARTVTWYRQRGHLPADTTPELMTGTSHARS